MKSGKSVLKLTSTEASLIFFIINSMRLWFLCPIYMLRAIAREILKSAQFPLLGRRVANPIFFDSTQTTRPFHVRRALYSYHSKE